MQYLIRRMEEETRETGDFIHEEFVRYGNQNGVALNYDEFCFAAENEAGGNHRCDYRPGIL